MAIKFSQFLQESSYEQTYTDIYDWGDVNIIENIQIEDFDNDLDSEFEEEINSEEEEEETIEEFIPDLYLPSKEDIGEA